MKKLTDVTIIRGDENYAHALNYSDYTQLFNFPVTINFLYYKLIFGFGSSDDIEVYKSNEYLYVLGTNERFSYISMYLVSLGTKQVLCDVFLSEQDLNDSGYPNIFNITPIEQIHLLQDYLTY